MNLLVHDFFLNSFHRYIWVVSVLRHWTFMLVHYFQSEVMFLTEYWHRWFLNRNRFLTVSQIIGFQLSFWLQASHGLMPWIWKQVLFRSKRLSWCHNILLTVWIKPDVTLSSHRFLFLQESYSLVDCLHFLCHAFLLFLKLSFHQLLFLQQESFVMSWHLAVKEALVSLYVLLQIF